MTAGFMGSPSHLSNYTVFGREVNVAARLESLSGSSRILITEHTLAEIQKSDPALATLAIPIGPHSVKGISQPIDVFSINWQEK
jgi:class 3 adenylate cyclase